MTAGRFEPLRVRSVVRRRPSEWEELLLLALPSRRFVFVPKRSVDPRIWAFDDLPFDDVAFDRDGGSLSFFANSHIDYRRDVMDERRMENRLSRRRFLGTSAAAAAWAILPAGAAGWSAGRPTGVADVRLGAISYSFRALPSSAEEVLGYFTQTGMMTVELMGGPAEAYAGAPEPPAFPRGRMSEMTEEEIASVRQARDEYQAEVGAWRRSASMDRFRALGRMYNDAGVEIDILKLGDADWSDEEIDYAFNAARAVGARGISFEISEESAVRMSPFADKHDMIIGMHNHTQVGEPGFSFDPVLTHSPNAMLNLDIGHYVAGTDESPVPVIRQYHDRISHLHIKDRRTGANGGDNVPFGEGDTPIGEVLRLLRDEGYPISAMIELEYSIPEDSDVLTEMARCVEYCRAEIAA